MEGADVQVETSGGVGLEVDAVRCLVFDFKDGGTESGFKKDVLAPATTDKTETLKEVYQFSYNCLK